MENIEEEGVKNIFKYFDRIHDKIFTFNNILIGGYFFLAKFDSNISFYTILIPISNLILIIYIEYRMMENSRKYSNITKMSLEEIEKNNQYSDNTTLLSFMVIITTSLVTLIFLIGLFSYEPVEKIDIIDKVEIEK